MITSRRPRPRAGSLPIELRFHPPAYPRSHHHHHHIAPTHPHAPTHYNAHSSPGERPLTIKFRTDVDDDKPPAAAQPETKASRGSRYRDDAPPPSAEPAQHPESEPDLSDHMRTALKRRESGRRVEAAHSRADDDEEDDVIRALEERKR